MSTSSKNSAPSRLLFERLETEETMLRLLDLAEASSDGVPLPSVRNPAFSAQPASPWSSPPPATLQDRIVGAIGVIGPTRINYGKIIPVVDYTARVIGRLLG